MTLFSVPLRSTDVKKASEGGRQQFHYRVKPENPNLNGSIMENIVAIFVTMVNYLLTAFKIVYRYPFDSINYLLLYLTTLVPRQLQGTTLHNLSCFSLLLS